MENGIALIDKTEIEGFRTDGSTAIEKAKTLALAIRDSLTLDIAAQFMLAAKHRAKRITDRLKQPKEDARKAWKNWCDLENELVEPYDRIEREIIKPAMARFQDAEDRKRRIEEDRLRAEQKKREEDAKLAAAQAAEDSGEHDIAEQIMDAPVMVAPVVLPPIATPAGISYRDVWKFEIVNPDLVPREYLTIDEKKIGGVVRALKGETKIQGVRIYSEKSVAGRV